MKNLLIENNGFAYGNCIYRVPKLYDTFSIDLKEDKSSYIFSAFKVDEVIEFITRLMVERLSSSYNELSLGGSIISIAEGENSIYRKYRAMVLDAVAKVFWYNDKKEICFNKDNILKYIVSTNKGFSHLFAKLFQAIDRKIIYSYISDAMAYLSEEQKQIIDSIIRIKMRYLSNRLRFGFCMNEDNTEISVFVTPRVQLRSSFQPQKFPLVYNATDHRLNAENVAIRVLFNSIIFRDKEFVELFDKLEITITSNSDNVAIDFILSSLFGRGVNYIDKNI